jgi:hypothetical protein
VITLAFCFGFNAWEGNFSLIYASNFSTREAICPIYFSKLWMLDLVSYWKDMTFCCNVTILEAKVFIISRRSSVDNMKTRLELEVDIIVNVYAQWLILHIKSSELLECLLSCNNHGVDASFCS